MSFLNLNRQIVFSLVIINMLVLTNSCNAEKLTIEINDSEILIGEYKVHFLENDLSLMNEKEEFVQEATPGGIDYIYSTLPLSLYLDRNESSLNGIGTSFYKFVDGEYVSTDLDLLLIDGFELKRGITIDDFTKLLHENSIQYEIIQKSNREIVKAQLTETHSLYSVFLYDLDKKCFSLSIEYE